MLTMSSSKSRSFAYSTSTVIPVIPHRSPEEQRHPEKNSKEDLNTVLKSREICCNTCTWINIIRGQQNLTSEHLNSICLSVHFLLKIQKRHQKK